MITSFALSCCSWLVRCVFLVWRRIKSTRQFTPPPSTLACIRRRWTIAAIRNRSAHRSTRWFVTAFPTIDRCNKAISSIGKKKSFNHEEKQNKNNCEKIQNTSQNLQCSDISAYYGGHHGDCNATFYVGKCDARSQKLVECSRQSLAEAIKMGSNNMHISLCWKMWLLLLFYLIITVRPGTMYRDVGSAIQKVADKAGCSVVRSYW